MYYLTILLFIENKSRMREVPVADARDAIFKKRNFWYFLAKSMFLLVLHFLNKGCYPSKFICVYNIKNYDNSNHSSLCLANGTYSSSKSSLPTPQSGHNHSSGMSSKAVPGAIPLSGSPIEGS